MVKKVEHNLRKYSENTQSLKCYYSQIRCDYPPWLRISGNKANNYHIHYYYYY